MEAISDTWTVYTIYQLKDRIDPKPAYQRGPVWQRKKQQLLIDSILRGYDMPKIYLRKISGGKYKYEVIDGQQRLRALWAFLDDEYTIGSESEDLPGDLTGKFYSQVSKDDQDKVGLFKVSISEIRDASDLSVRELFLRLQNGVSLNQAEKRNAVAGPVRDFVNELAEEHSLFPALTAKENERFSWQELAALALRLELAEGPADLKAKDLNAMYENQSFSPQGDAAKNCKATLDVMWRVARLAPGSIKTRWGFVDLYLALRALRVEHDLRRRERSILENHLELEKQRLDAQSGSLDELLGTDENGERDPAKSELFTYISAFSREGGTRKNIEARHKIYLKRLRGALFSEAPEAPASSND
ncbi:DUF262 domain-containing protein [Streptomyces sp. BRA346]|uniref:DUF262 domain-containing protein n=1 Tax=Streptomyces sp. BRA346 TaxID=2878199 RepID=UPI0040635BC9